MTTVTLLEDRATNKFSFKIEFIDLVNTPYTVNYDVEITITENPVIKWTGKIKAVFDFEAMATRIVTHHAGTKVSKKTHNEIVKQLTNLLPEAVSYDL